MVEHLALIGVRLAIVAAGLALAYLSFRAYRKSSGTGPLLALSAAFTLITVGAVIEGVLFEFVGYSLTQVHAIESAVTAIGLAIVLYAIQSTRH